MSLDYLKGSKSYKVICFLARKHGLNALEALISSKVYRIECVFTHALNPKSEDPMRSARCDFEHFVKLAKDNNIPLFTVDSVEDGKQIDTVFDSINDLDFIVSVSWRRLILKKHLDVARFGGVNLHRGKLPDYSGAEPIKQAINNGEKSICITSHVMTELIDSGEIIALANYSFEYNKNETIETNISHIKENITELFGPLLIDSLNQLASRQNERDKN